MYISIPDFISVIKVTPCLNQSQLYSLLQFLFTKEPAPYLIDHKSFV